MKADEIANMDSVEVVNFSGMGDDYDRACFTLFLRSLRAQEQGKDPIEIDTEDIGPTGAMMRFAVANAEWVHENSYEEWLESNEERVETWHNPSLRWPQE